MDPRLQEMLDHHEIRQLLATYCHGCDRIDGIEMASVYCHESWDDHGPNKCDGKDFAMLMTRHMSDTSVVCSHQLGQSLIKLNGDEAGVETYFIASIRYPPSNETDILNQMGGRYVDTLRREDGQWKIKKRICIREWSITHRVVEDWLPCASFVGPEASQADCSYEALRLTHSGIPEQSVAV